MSSSQSNIKGPMVVMLLIGALAFILPVSFSFWIVSFLSSWFSSELESPSPLRWLLSLLIPVIISAWGLRKKSLDISGAILGLFVGFLMTISNFCFLACLITFFVSSSKVTKIGIETKRKLEADFKEGGQRNWVQVICNGGVAAEIALLYMIEKGCTEITIDFHSDYMASWLSIAVLAAMAGANGDTWASELGPITSLGDPFLITNFKKVPKGTNGGVSLSGLIFSALGGMAVGLGYYISLLLVTSQVVLDESAPQWPLIIVGLFAGLFMSIVDSILGATLQFSGIEPEHHRIVERPGPGVKHISGIAFLDNHSVNLLSSLISALLVPFFAIRLWAVLR